jgi:hypothetical protein
VKYILMICGDRNAADVPDILAGCGGWASEMERRGILRDSVGLHSPNDATTVRVRSDKVMVVDGPFAETRDQIGGFSVIECDDLDVAIDVAAAHPAAAFGMIEIRPVRDETPS